MHCKNIYIFFTKNAKKVAFCFSRSPYLPAQEKKKIELIAWFLIHCICKASQFNRNKYFVKLNSRVILHTTSPTCINCIFLGTSSITFCSFSLSVYSFLTPSFCRAQCQLAFSLQNYSTLHRISFHSAKSQNNSEIGWQYFVNVPYLFLSWAHFSTCSEFKECPLLFCEVSCGWSTAGAVKAGGPRMSGCLSASTWVDCRCSRNSSCWSWALPCSLSQAFTGTMSGAHFADALHNLLLTGQKVE